MGEIRTYRFDAPPGHQIVVGSVAYEAGATINLDEDMATDDRLTLLVDVDDAPLTEPVSADPGPAPMAIPTPDADVPSSLPPLHDPAEDNMQGFAA